MFFVVHQDRKMYGPEVYCREVPCGIDDQGKVVFSTFDTESRIEDRDDIEMAKGKIYHNGPY